MKILIFSTADWEHPFWTNKQHVAKTLANLGHKVVYIESLGLRKIRVGVNDRNRIFRRVKGIFNSPRKVMKNLWVISPIVIPGIDNKLINVINMILMQITLFYSYRKLKFTCNILWTYNPATILYIKPSNFKCSLYHCVDDIGHQPDMPRKQISLLESKLANNVDILVTTNNKLKDKLKDFSKKIYVLPNVVDYEHFSQPTKSAIKGAKHLINDIPKPRIGFVGAISKYKLDFELIEKCANQYTEFSFIFIGAIGEGEGQTDISELSKIKNIYFLGPKSYYDLPGLMSHFDIGIIPSRISPYTDAMFPMKFFEYLAAGLPVIATSIDSLSAFNQEAFLCDPTVDDFSQAINLTLKGNTPDLEIRLRLAKSNTYQQRTLNMTKEINNII